MISRKNYVTTLSIHVTVSLSSPHSMKHVNVIVAHATTIIEEVERYPFHSWMLKYGKVILQT